MEQGAWSPISLGKDAPSPFPTYFLLIIFFFFFFAEVSLAQMDIVNSVLDNFYNSSGQKVNREIRLMSFSLKICQTGIGDSLVFHLGLQRDG